MLGFPLILVFYTYLSIIYILTPAFVIALPCRTVVALLWALYQPLFSLGLCLLFPHTSPTYTTLAVETLMFMSYTFGITFAYCSTGLTGSIPVIGAVVSGVVGYFMVIDSIYRSIFVRHGLGGFLASSSALDRLRFLFQDNLRGLRIVFAGLTWMGMDGEAGTEGNALDVVSSPQGQGVRDIPPPYSCQYSPLPYAQV